MTIHEKLSALLEDRTVAKVARKAGINPVSFANSLRRRSAITTDWACRLAAALNVDAGWLIDDARELPAGSAATSKTGVAA